MTNETDLMIFSYEDLLVVISHSYPMWPGQTMVVIGYFNICVVRYNEILAEAKLKYLVGTTILH